ncbi:MAG: glycosyltransferase [Clostridia bacterium]|nr:glycosyltransferase [Clostridia bacterium]
MTDVSIIIPIYNAQKYLEECIESIISQLDFICSEVILVDDGSADRSPEICDSYSEKYGNIFTVHKKNAGVSSARNDGIKAASGEFIMFCDADDRLKNDILTEVINTARDYSPDIIFWNYTYENNDKKFVTDFPFVKNRVLDRVYIQKNVPEFMLRDSSFNSVWNKAFKKSIIENNGILFNSEKKYGEDREFLLTYLAGCSNGFFIPEDGYFYRDTVSGAIKKERTDFFDNITQSYYTNVICYKKLGFDEKETEQICKAALPENIIDDVFFIYENYNKKVFSRSLESLFNNELLLKAVSEYIDSNNFKNENYRIAAEKICRKNTGSLRRFLNSLKAKEAVYRIIKG